MNRRFTWPDERLIKAAQDGDVSSLTTVVVQSQPHVRKFALSLCASPQDAEDAAQEALIILYRKIGTLRATGALASWMFRIVRNECLRQMRLLASRREGASDQPETPDGPSAEESVLHRMEVERIAAAIGALPRDQRQVLVMRDIQGLPGRTVADTLGLSGAAMKSRLHRARTTLRHSLATTGQMPGPAVDPSVGGDPRP
ncbi:RNA polymerase sigma factor [Streptomyces gardneri]|uniref:RNA polymerase sigma factor n=1 Tax=Streptomyces gardneri TaxID=66892 RepID=A0A4Y3RBF8_9ACTN|nr:RNA polymerase sigma factor [Streptomyces gardneri]GEB55105.1 RNA polymerase sigma factor [Streptomyces gardneri]GHG96956.1 RNA polymerase sigma factor [Streptomyces gardneri]